MYYGTIEKMCSPESRWWQADWSLGEIGRYSTNIDINKDS